MLITFHFPPSPEIGAARSGALRDVLQARGHQVSVVAAAQSGIPDDADPTVLRTPWFDFSRLVIVRNAPSSQQDELEHATRLAKPVTGLPSSPIRGRLQASEFIRPGSPARRRAAQFRNQHFRFIDRQQGWARPAQAAGKALSQREDFDIIIAIGPPTAAYVAAARLAAELKVPWVADYRDLWTAGSHYQFPEWLRKLDRRREAGLLRTAALTTTVSAPLAHDMEAHFGVDCEVVRNGYDEFEPVQLVDREPLSEAALNLVYVGGAFYGGKRTPERIFRAARALNLSMDQIRIHFLGTDVGYVTHLAETAGVLELLQCHPPVDRSGSMEFQSRADALLLLGSDSIDDVGDYSGKVFEYLAARRPIVFNGNSRSVAADLIRDTHRGYVASNDQEMEAAVSALVHQKVDNRLFEDLPQADSEYSRDAQCGRMIELMEAIVSRGTL